MEEKEEEEEEEDCSKRYGNCSNPLLTVLVFNTFWMQLLVHIHVSSEIIIIMYPWKLCMMWRKFDDHIASTSEKDR